MCAGKIGDRPLLFELRIDSRAILGLLHPHLRELGVARFLHGGSVEEILREEVVVRLLLDGIGLRPLVLEPRLDLLKRTVSRGAYEFERRRTAAASILARFLAASSAAASSGNG